MRVKKRGDGVSAALTFTSSALGAVGGLLRLPREEAGAEAVRLAPPFLCGGLARAAAVFCAARLWRVVTSGVWDAAGAADAAVAAARVRLGAPSASSVAERAEPLRVFLIRGRGGERENE